MQSKGQTSGVTAAPTNHEDMMRQTVQRSEEKVELIVGGVGDRDRARPTAIGVDRDIGAAEITEHLHPAVGQRRHTPRAVGAIGGKTALPQRLAAGSGELHRIIIRPAIHARGQRRGGRSDQHTRCRGGVEVGQRLRSAAQEVDLTQRTKRTVSQSSHPESA